nr:unnamed protein product [Digitaria exilis]
MVTFLTRLFPYLAECEAVRFLLFADADLLVAAHIVALDLGLTRRQASEPDRLVGDWLAISTRVDETVALLEEVHRRSPASSLSKLANLLDGLPLPTDGDHEDLRGLRHLIPSRLPPPRSVPYRYSPAMKATLQDAIHDYYLKAIARLPAGELRSRFHRSLLEGGHCYGPFDPVSNIIVNTI